MYQPLEDLYIVLITNLQSNILQDIDTLHLLAPLVVASVRNVDERDVLNNCFEILSAFDEVLTLGYKENLTVSQVSTYLEMESHEEKIHNIIERNKEIEVAEQTKRKAKQLENMRSKEAELKRSGISNMSGGFGSDSFSPVPSAAKSFSSNSPQSPARSLSPAPSAVPARQSGGPRKGMLLGKKRNDALGSLRDTYESETSRLIEDDAYSKAQSKPSAPAAAAAAPVANANRGIHIAVHEEITATIARMGDIQSADVKGSLQLQIGDPSLTNIQIQVRADGPGSQYRTHPNVDKSAFLQQKVIKVKDSKRSFPSNNQQLSVLRWATSANGTAAAPKATELVPIEFHCWFSAGDNGIINGIVEYELVPEYEGAPITDIRVQIPLLSGNVTVSSTDQTWNQYDDEIEWIIKEIVPGTESAQGSLEWAAEATSEDDFFPMPVAFKITSTETGTVGKVDVLDVVNDSEESVEFEKEVIVEANNVQIV